MFYLDTSLIVSALTNEATTDAVQAWIRARVGEPLFISDWSVTEFSSALSVNIRNGRLTTNQRDQTLSEFDRFQTTSLTLIPVEAKHFRSAARFTCEHRLALRSGDALHLAIASDNDLTVATLDRRLAAAGAPLGVSTELLA